MVGEAYCRRKYEKYQQFFPDFDWPEWADLDFRFEANKGEWGAVLFSPSGIQLSLHPSCQRDAGMSRSTIAHEMVHIFIGPKYGHGKRFNAVLLGALNAGLIAENLI